MAIDVKVKPLKTTQIRQFPYLGQYGDGMIVLFTNDNCGTVVNQSRGINEDKPPVGHYSRSWWDQWDVFEGTVEISYDRDK